jgi:hypothetical protein
MADSSAPTRVMMAVNESSLKGHLHPSISCRAAFDWTLSKLIHSNTVGFQLLFLHVQVPDEDGMFTLAFCSCFLRLDFFTKCVSSLDSPVRAAVGVDFICDVATWVIDIRRHG